MTTPNDPSAEDSLIARYFKPLATDPGAFALVDDAAILSSSGDDIVVTTDAVVEGVHYLATDPPDTIARKALRVNLSDLAAKGAAPAGFVLTLALRSKEDGWLRPFADALGEDAKSFGCPLLGGDTVSTPGPQMISITAFGRVPKGRMVGRTGARPGDLILVTGTIGDAALGLDVLAGGAVATALTSDPAAKEALISRYRVPQPRNVLAQAVRDYATAAMDVSDGLAGDLTKLCAASGVSATVKAASVPLSSAAAGLIACNAICVETLLAGGDDYEVLCTVPPAQSDALITKGRAAGLAVTAIGTIVAGHERPRFLDGQGQELVLKRLSYSHF
ncbi:thiamine-phosphate kinase [Bradyrhizobium sp. LB11.1]|uniref:thiamine-phosphate kinase n=1 Tax=Bradyrhizobium sp. LB11.1 TaxID=3156326 RepID=UPI003392E9F9